MTGSVQEKQDNPIGTISKWTWRSLVRPRFGLRSLLLFFVLIGIALAYVGSYVSRSRRGRYEPVLIGLGGVKLYGWAPEGFVVGFIWDRNLVRWYYPLWTLDNRIWHIQRGGFQGGGMYPINEVPPEEIGRIYKAWDEEAARLRK